MSLSFIFRLLPFLSPSFHCSIYRHSFPAISLKFRIKIITTILTTVFRVTISHKIHGRAYTLRSLDQHLTPTDWTNYLSGKILRTTIHTQKTHLFRDAMLHPDSIKLTRKCYNAFFDLIRICTLHTHTNYMHDFVIGISRRIWNGVQSESMKDLEYHKLQYRPIENDQYMRFINVMADI